MLPSTFVSAERVRAVEHHEFLPVLGCGFHSEPHSGDEGVAAGADVLDVIDEHIYVLKHLRGWLFGFTVERVDGHSGFRIGVIGHVGSGHMVASDAPCSGAKRAVSLTLWASARMSIVDLSELSTPVGFVMRPTRIPSSSSKPLRRSTSMPGSTAGLSGLWPVTAGEVAAAVSES